jgi:di/tricarboxylate transporter
MPLEAWITLAIIVVSFSALMLTRIAPDALLIAAVGALMVLGVITPGEALVGMSNEGMITVGALFVVASALTQTGVVAWVSQTLLGGPTSLASAQMRLMAPVVAFSSVLNNTPVVAMLVPAVSDWAKRHELSVSQLMIPLSYAAMIGGVCTLIGTSTNLVINGMMLDLNPETGLGIFELAWVGLPCAVLVLLYIVVFSRWLLPHRKEQTKRFENPREYTVEMLLEPHSPIVGLTIRDAGLRHLPGVFLVEIERDGRPIPAPDPSKVLRANDRLVFAGDVESVVDLQKIRGLRPAEDQIFKLNSNRAARGLVEVAISPAFPSLGKTVRESGFRKVYGAAIIAVARDGEQLKGRIGDIILKPGDTLLLEASPDFVEQQRYSRNFLLVSQVSNSQPLRHDKRKVSVLILLAMIFSVALGFTTMFKAVFLAAGAMIATRCISVHGARQSVSWEILLVIAASISIGGAVEKTGLAVSMAEGLISMVGGSPRATLAALFLLVAGFSAVISNLAAAVLLFPVIVAISNQLGADLTPFAVTLMVAASACFSTPIGYQTNLMVYGPGDYRFTDFMKIGIPLTALVGVVTVLLVPIIWPFF